ncbi:MAG: trypsin-like serine protease [Myxococcota bacterium]
MFSPTALAVLVSLAFATGEAQPIEPQQIYGGDYVDTCGWPSVVYLSGGGGACTGTLIHPRIVLTAAHCVTQDIPSAVRFGETAQSAQQLSQTITCRQGPGWNGATNQGEDYAYCLLDAPVTSIPIIPVVNGCEASAVYQGARIMHVGFGREEDGSSGRKKMLELNINAITASGELISGTPNEIICNGDSGGPTFVYLDPAQGGDGSWRVAAIHSWAQGADPVDPNCQNAAGSVLATNAITWIEEDSGIDITPCADGDTWSPTAQCGNIPMDPWAMEGGYPNCSSPEVVEWASTCGAGLDATPDDAAPVVTVLSPNAGDSIDADGTAEVEVAVDVTDEGWGVDTVSMTIRSVATGDEQQDVRNEWQSWSWNLGLPPGSYEVILTATDHAGNTSQEQVVCFGVGEPGCEEAGGDDGSSGGLSGGTGGGDDGDGDGGDDGGGTSGTSANDDGGGDDDGGDGGSSGAAADGSGDGGGCRIGGSNGSFALWLLVLAIPLRRRR